jgi:transposase
MGKPYSVDLRERVREAIDSGETHMAVAGMFQIGIATVERYVARWKRTGSLAPDKFGGHMRYKLAEYKEKVMAIVKAEPDQTLMELQEKLACSGIEVSKSALDRFLKALDLSYKKNTCGDRTETPRRSRSSRRMA